MVKSNIENDFFSDKVRVYTNIYNSMIKIKNILIVISLLTSTVIVATQREDNSKIYENFINLPDFVKSSYKESKDKTDKYVSPTTQITLKDQKFIKIIKKSEIETKGNFFYQDPKNKKRISKYNKDELSYIIFWGWGEQQEIGGIVLKQSFIDNEKRKVELFYKPTPEDIKQQLAAELLIENEEPKELTSYYRSGEREAVIKYNINKDLKNNKTTFKKFNKKGDLLFEAIYLNGAVVKN